MNILKLVEVVLSDALRCNCEDYIDIRFTIAQAIELRDTLHRITTYNENMKGDKNNDSMY